MDDLKKLTEEAVEAVRRTESEKGHKKDIEDDFLKSLDAIDTRPNKQTEMKKCKQCAMMIPKDAKICPHCRKPQGWTLAAKIVAGFFILIVISATMNSGKNTSTPTPDRVKTPEETRKEMIERGFSAWDGSHRGLETIIKKSMNDPDSYKHEETVYSDKGDHLIVKTTFRGKNAFGGVVKNLVVAKADLDGNIIEVISQGP